MDIKSKPPAGGGTTLGYGLQGSGFRVQGSVFRFQDSGFRVQGVWGSGFRVQGAGFRVQGLVVKVQSWVVWRGEGLGSAGKQCTSLIYFHASLPVFLYTKALYNTVYKKPGKRQPRCPLMSTAVPSDVNRSSFTWQKDVPGSAERMGNGHLVDILPRVAARVLVYKRLEGRARKRTCR